MTTVFQRLGAYEILEEIGRGGMAAVFLALDTREDRRVALKLVPLRESGEGREILDAERWGGRLQMRLSADCDLVPRVYEDGDLPPYYFIAMEYVEGENLSDMIARGPLPPAEAIRIGIELCKFLEAAHRFETTIDGQAFRSLLHGDLKPLNVRVTPTGAIKVLDFGIAKALSLSRKVTRNDFGSIPYMSPERLDAAEPKVDAHADLWAFGVMLYQMLAGAPPFHARDSRALENQIRAGYARRPLPAELPLAVRAIAARLLAPRLEDRYPSAAAVLEDLQRFAEGQQTAAEQEGFPARIEDAPTERTRPPRTDENPEEATRRTARDSNAAGVKPAAVAAPPVAAAPRRRRRPFRTAIIILALFIVLNEMSVGFDANRLAAAATTQSLDDLTVTWDEYANLSRRSHLRFGVMGLERTLRIRVQQLADEVIANYRSPNPTVRERQWRTAQKHLQLALILSPSDKRLRAGLRYCEGHIHRIDGEADKQRKRTASANQHFTEALAAFREAAELRTRWPDPFLGLARTYIYGLDDVERAAEALREASRLGYAIGERETAQLGDGYRARGDNLRATARQLATLPQEEEYLERAASTYREALVHYERIPDFSDVARNIRRTRRALEEIDRRRAEIAAAKEEPIPLGPSWE